MTCKMGTCTQRALRKVHKNLPSIRVEFDGGFDRKSFWWEYPTSPGDYCYYHQKVYDGKIIPPKDPIRSFFNLEEEDKLRHVFTSIEKKIKGTKRGGSAINSNV